MNFRFEKILKHKTFTELIKKTEERESDRIFCRHGMEHIISVARIAYIMALEHQLDISKDIVYAAALLHDIGRNAEYEHGISHSQAGADIAEQILSDCGYSQTETREIITAILSHRHDKFDTNASPLDMLICKADKLSRTCFDCTAYSECNWSEEKKNKTLVY